LGRRQSIERTTARRCPSARKRPEAGYLPTLASGRPRGVRREDTMTLPGRAPREVYRVYTEAEFFATAVADAELFEPVGGASISAERRRRRLAGVAALAGAMGTVGGVVAVTIARAPRHAGGTGGGAGRAARVYVARRTPLNASSQAWSGGAAPVVAVAQPATGARGMPGPRTSQSRAGDHGRARGGAQGGRRRWHAEGARPHIVLAADAAPVRASGVATGATSVGASAPPVLVANRTVSRTDVSPRPQHVEFGFER
jgi:hypothetical protein